jgi:hypothetical protein
MKMQVKVWSDLVEIDVEQHSKSVWVASGDYLGKSYQTKDRTASTAAKRWAEAARYHSN